jgi:hypothetical protein
MDKLRFNYWFLLVFALTIFMGACEKDDDNISPESKDEKQEQTREDEKPEVELTLYQITGEDIRKLKDFKVSGSSLALQKDTKKHQEIWSMTKQVIPSKERVRFGELMFIESKESGAAGYVTQTEDDLLKWQLGIAIDMAYEGGFNKDGELAYTLIHEFGHVLSLNETQIDFIKPKEECTTYHIDEGCTKEDSYLYCFYKTFWTDIIEEFNQVGDSEDKAYEFYTKYENRFVTEYASTNPVEDFAECFAFFVTKTERPTGESITDKKIALFYDYPKLIEIRNYIRKNAAIKLKGSYTMLPEPGSWKKAKRFNIPNSADKQ